MKLLLLLLWLPIFALLCSKKCSAQEIPIDTPDPKEEKPVPKAEEPAKKEPERDVQNLTFQEKVGRVRLTWDLEEDYDVDHIEVFGKYFNDKYCWRYDGFHKMTRSVELALDPLCKVELTVHLVFHNGTRSTGKTVTATARHRNVVEDHVEGRKLHIYLPDGYDQENENYPVIYMHDGQNLFSPRLAYITEWRIDHAMKRLVKNGKMGKAVVVGIYNSSKRAEEYTPFADKRFGGGKAREFSQFIVEKIMPYVETKYRISRKREDRAVMGSSFGGILSLWMGYTYPEVFSTVAAISPSLWIADGAMLRELEEQPKKNIKIWLDQGTGEWSDFTRNAVSILVNKGYEYGKELIYYEVKDAVHNEQAWAERIDCPFILFKGKEPGKIIGIRLDLQEYRQFSIGPKRYVINPIAHFENGMWYSLYTSAKYSLEDSGPATMDETGVLEFNNAQKAKVIVKFGDKEETLTIINPHYEPPKPKPAPAKKKSAKGEKVASKAKEADSDKVKPAEKPAEVKVEIPIPATDKALATGKEAPKIVDSPYEVLPLPLDATGGNNGDPKGREVGDSAGTIKT